MSFVCFSLWKKDIVGHKIILTYGQQRIPYWLQVHVWQSRVLKVAPGKTFKVAILPPSFTW
jgi:hypothetical protein